MFDNSLNLIQMLSFSDSDKEILSNLLGNCQAPLTTSRPITFTGPVTLGGPTTVTNPTTLETINNAIAVSCAVTQAGHVLAGSSKSDAHYVVAQACTDMSGSGATGATFHVLLPSPSSATDPNVEMGTVIAYVTDKSGNNVCVSGYLDSCRGTIKIWGGSAASIPHGWQLCDGTNSTPDLQGRFVIGAKPGDTADGIDVGEIGGTSSHTHAPHSGYETLPTSLDTSVAVDDPTISVTVNATSLTATSTADAATSSEFTGYPATIDTTPNMTGSPIAAGTPTQSNIPVIIDSATTTLSMDDVMGSISVDIPQTSINVVLGKGSLVCFVSSGSGGSCSDITASASVDLPVTGTATTTIIAHVRPTDIVLPVTGITFTDSSTDYTPEGTVLSDTDVEVTTTISPSSHTHTATATASHTTVNVDILPDPHEHDLPSMTHDTQSHIPPYYALCYIQRVS